MLAHPEEPDRRGHLVIIAEAFELRPRDVFVDASILELSRRADADVFAWLQERHGCDNSVPPYYVQHLRELLS